MNIKTVLATLVGLDGSYPPNPSSGRARESLRNIVIYMARGFTWQGSTLADSQGNAAPVMWEILPSSIADEYGGYTLTRIVGAVGVVNGSTDNNSVRVGVIVVNKEATSTTIPDPVSDPNAKWMFWKHIPMVEAGAPTVSDAGFSIIDMDIKVQRKVSRDQKVVLVIDDLAGDFDIADSGVRCLLKLP